MRADVPHPRLSVGASGELASEAPNRGRTDTIPLTFGMRDSEAQCLAGEFRGLCK